jgi:hypothetical protein
MDNEKKRFKTLYRRANRYRWYHCSIPHRIVWKKQQKNNAGMQKPSLGSGGWGHLPGIITMATLETRTIGDKKVAVFSGIGYHRARNDKQ